MSETKTAGDTKLKAAAPREKTLLEWSVHLWARDPLHRRVLSLAVPALALAAVQVLSGTLLLTVAMGAILAVATGEYFFPMRMRLTDRGAYRVGLWGARRLSWSKVRRVLDDPMGVKLSVFTRSHPWEAWRGLFLFCPDNREEVAEAARKAIRTSDETEIGGGGVGAGQADSRT